MLQKHSILFWAEPKAEGIKELAQKGTAIIETINKFGPEIEIKYILDKKSKQFIKFKTNISEFIKILENNRNKEGKIEFSDLGYNMCFLSSLSQKHCTSIELLIGLSFPSLVNSLIIKLTNSVNIYDNFFINKSIKLFKSLIKIYKPFWGCISNDLNKTHYDKYVNNNKPTAVHWLNFWGRKLLNELNVSNWDNAPIEEYEQINDGYFIKLKKEPIDDEDEKDLLIQQNANRFFNLV